MEEIEQVVGGSLGRSQKLIITAALIFLVLVASAVIYHVKLRPSTQTCSSFPDVATTSPPIPPPSFQIYWPIRSQEKFEKHHATQCQERDMRFPFSDTEGPTMLIGQRIFCLKFSCRDSTAYRAIPTPSRLFEQKVFCNVC